MSMRVRVIIVRMTRNVKIIVKYFLGLSKAFHNTQRASKAHMAIYTSITVKFVIPFANNNSE